MRHIRTYKLLLFIAIIGLIVSIGGCVKMGFNSIGLSIGGHGEAAVNESKRTSNQAELFFFLSMALLLAVVVLLYAISKAKARNSGQIN